MQRVAGLISRDRSARGEGSGKAGGEACGVAQPCVDGVSAGCAIGFCGKRQFRRRHVRLDKIEDPVRFLDRDHEVGFAADGHIGERVAYAKIAARAGQGQAARTNRAGKDRVG